MSLLKTYISLQCVCVCVLCHYCYEPDASFNLIMNSQTRPPTPSFFRRMRASKRAARSNQLQASRRQARKPARKQTSQPASKEANQPASQSASQPASQPASKEAKSDVVSPNRLRTSCKAYIGHRPYRSSTGEYISIIQLQVRRRNAQFIYIYIYIISCLDASACM